jgi:hypothetical protein
MPQTFQDSDFFYSGPKFRRIYQGPSNAGYLRVSICSSDESLHSREVVAKFYCELVTSGHHWTFLETPQDGQTLDQLFDLIKLKCERKAHELELVAKLAVLNEGGYVQ